MSSAEEIKTEYMSSLADLKFNSKPLINVLTMLAEENSPNAEVIVEAIETHLSKVSADVKLPVLYLIDCIMKNVGGTYTNLFSKNIVSTFCGVFGVVDEKTRAEMFKLRQTWNDVFPQMKLYAIDVQIAHLDPAWPVTAKAPPNSIHFNPKFLKTKTPVPAIIAPMVTPPTGTLDKQTLLMQEELIQKQKELLELKQRKLELEVLQTKVKLQEQIKNNPPIPQNILLKPEVAKQLVPSIKPKTAVTMPVAQQAKISNVIPSSNNSPRSQNVNTVAKPIRDPRLLRQQQQQQPQQQQNPSDNQLGQKTANLDNNKIVTNNKTNGRKPRRDPRLIINKDDKTPIPKSDTNKPIPTKSNNSESKHPKPKSTSSISGSTDSLGKTKRSSPMRHKKRHKGDKSDEPAAFKSAKGLAKGRNYVRRNLSSPEAPSSPKAAVTRDEDLRGFAAPPQKQPRLQEAPAPPTGLESKNGTIDCSVKDKDVDLRHLPAIITRKRLSADSPEAVAAKKSKSEMMDRLFGAKDTDLRQLPITVKEKPLPASEKETPMDPVEATKSPRSDFSRAVVVIEDRPPTPPPPIISSSPSKRDSTKNDLDIVRAKLANATNKMSKTMPKKPTEDRDLRFFLDSDASHKVIISKEDEHKIRSGDMTKEQEADLLKKIIMQIEINKLNEAKKKETTPISDEELSDGDEKKQKTTQESSIIPFKDKDERLNVKALQPSGRAATGSEFFSTFGRDFRRFPGPQAWRGGRGATPRWSGPVWENPPRPRGWAPPPPPSGNWRNAPTRNPHHEDEAASGGSPDVACESPSLPDGVVNQNEIKTIAIDGSQKDIRFYDETAVVFLNWDDPREISFLDPKGRRVVFNDDVECFLEFGEPYKDVVINGSVHKVRLGAPSREIYIDFVPYECYFGSPGIRIELNGAAVTVKLDGPPPQVKIGEVKRRDLVAGKVTLFVDAKVMMPIFLDAKPQQFVVNGKMCTLKFVNALKTVKINDKAFDVEYGGLPKPVMIYGKRRFIRFSVLPRGIRPGRVKIKDMEGGGLSPMHADENSQDGSPYFDPTEPALPAIGRNKRRNVADSPDRNSNSPNAYQNLLEQQSLNNLDLLTPSLGSVSATGGYQLDNSPHGEEPKGGNSSNVAAPTLPNPLNINELFQKLVSSGFITTGPKDDRTEKIETVDDQQSKARRSVCAKLKLITFARPETLKVRQAALYSHLYAGMQCSSCGMRFSPEASMQYSQHLDWHFRQNRKGKRNSRVASSRKWFYSLSDWKNYEELEDMEEREKNYFDQQQQSEGANDDADEDMELPSVPADPDSTDECCEMCRDKFDQFFNEEREEWHLENAIRVDEKTYHPVCYEDYQKSLLDTQPDDNKLEQPIQEEEKKEEQIPGLEIVIDDDDEEEMKATNDDDEPYEPGDIVSLGSDESKPNEQEEKQSEEVEEEKEKKKEDEDDDDVILNEVAPIKIIVDDDEDGEDKESKDKAEDGEEEKVFQIKDEKPDDGFMEVAGLVSLPNGGQIKIKAEPIDPDDLPPEAPVEARPPPEPKPAETEDSYPAHTELVPSIDGNIDLVTSVPTTGVTTVVSANKIKINISKPLPVIHNKEKESAPDAGFPSETYIDPSEPFPPGEEPEQLRPSRLKPALEGVELRRLPPVKRGSELTGLCSIM